MIAEANIRSCASRQIRLGSILALHLLGCIFIHICVYDPTTCIIQHVYCCHLYCCSLHSVGWVLRAKTFSEHPGCSVPNISRLFMCTTWFFGVHICTHVRMISLYVYYYWYYCCSLHSVGRSKKAGSNVHI